MDPIEEIQPEGPLSGITSAYREFLELPIHNEYDDPLIFWLDSKFPNLKHIAASFFLHSYIICLS